MAKTLNYSTLAIVTDAFILFTKAILIYTWTSLYNHRILLEGILKRESSVLHFWC